MTLKICIRCNEEKPLIDFNNDKTRIDGKQSYCRKCINAAQRKSYYKSEKRINRAKRVASERAEKLTRPEKKCTSCEEVKWLDEFYNDSHHIDGKNSACKSCINKRNGLNRRKYTISQYGITIEEYDEFFNRQQGRCALPHCRKEGRLCIDHDHETGVVRGLLCVPCNSSLGALGDTKESIKGVLSYLTR